MEIAGRVRSAEAHQSITLINSLEGAPFQEKRNGDFQGQAVLKQL
jgi:hypothetical protein